MEATNDVRNLRTYGPYSTVAVNPKIVANEVVFLDDRASRSVLLFWRVTIIHSALRQVRLPVPAVKWTYGNESKN